MRIRFYNGLVLIGHKFEEKEVWVKDNLIEYVGESKQTKLTFDREIDLQGNILMPGLINMHAHSALTYGRGLKDDVELETWLSDHIFPLEAGYIDKDIYWGTLQTIKDYVRGGTTCCLDMYFRPDEQYEAYFNSGFRSIVAVLPKELEKHKHVLDKQNDMFKIWVHFHSVYTTDEKDIIDAMNMAKELNTGITVHISETLKEVGDSDVKFGNTPAGYLNEFGFFDYPVVAAHCVHLDKNDVEIFAKNNVTICSNPSSNLKLASGIAPLYTFQTNNINITLGTDSSASNNSLDMFKEMNLAATLEKAVLYNPKVMTSNEIIDMATINAAKALRINNLGLIKEGYLADLICLNIKEPNYYPHKNLNTNFVYCANSKDVYLTMINGKIVYENGEYYLAEDAELISEKFEELANRLIK